MTLRAEVVIDDGDTRLRRALLFSGSKSRGLFVFIDHDRHRSLCGIGDKPHPHAGIEVVSELPEGGVEHHAPTERRPGLWSVQTEVLNGLNKKRYQRGNDSA